ncbi:MAG: epoxyqueuosine reductase [Desulfobacterales bacterium]|nr:epoxyqueuosine reductase [Desulfobacterales bacterium]
MDSDNCSRIINKAKALGAVMAGIASFELLKKSPSHEILKKIGMGTDGVGSAPGESGENEKNWPENAKSVLVIAVSHPEDRPELDWWDGYKGTPGNRLLIRINRDLSDWIEATLGIKTHKMPYFIEKGGIYLKDAAVLAGLGCIGKNNILITPGFGPRVRLRAMLLEEELKPTGPIGFDPCDACEEFCRKACPQNAFEKTVFLEEEMGISKLPGRNGCYSRSNCNIQMGTDIVNAEIEAGEMDSSDVDVEDVSQTNKCIKYCRRCELACPV